MSAATITKEAHRILVSRQFGVAAAQALTISGLSFDEAGAKVGKSGTAMRRQMMRMLDGRSLRLDDVSDFFVGCSAEPHIIIRPRVELQDAS